MSISVFQVVMHSRALRVAGLALAVSAGLSVGACGRRGDLEPPPGVENPAPPPGTVREAPAEGERPNKPFVLDGLL
ncbi:LPS translocon maturation chaperone LptM [Tepidamorphus sp. 3E244]|uniref:LPS translocon maturation chaperone LptM n=1 Tax=Tepidamorphus sp. 3E244 TaxID=3385498 RepID=UPI0038FC89DB